MSGDWDATLKSVSAVDQGTSFTIDAIKAGTAFDVVADVEVGAKLISFNTTHSLFVSVRDITGSTTITGTTDVKNVPGQAAPFTKPLTVSIPAGWAAKEGDILQVAVAYKVDAGAGNVDYSTDYSQEFVVTV